MPPQSSLSNSRPSGLVRIKLFPKEYRQRAETNKDGQIHIPFSQCATLQSLHAALKEKAPAVRYFDKSVVLEERSEGRYDTKHIGIEAILKDKMIVIMSNAEWLHHLKLCTKRTYHTLNVYLMVSLVEFKYTITNECRVTILITIPQSFPIKYR